MHKNSKAALSVTAFVVGMFCLAYASVPLYSLFCKSTGFGGTTQRAAASKVTGHRKMTVIFNANVDGNLPWEFRPDQQSVTVTTGENKLVSFSAENLSGESITGTATYNVTPEKMGSYFTKIQCFCFTEQTLKPKQKITLPVSFFIDPAIEQDSNMDNVTTVTLSYSFFKKKG